MTVHPPIPYSSCLLYQANQSDNTQRSNFYGIIGTPTLVINGITKKSLGSVNAATLNMELNKTSAIEILVKESGKNNRSATIEVKTHGNKPNGNFRLYVAAVEKELNYASPNGEKIHHNVFRDFLSAADGDSFDLPNTGQSTTKNYSITIPSQWNESQIYMLAWIQDADTKEVLNSGTIYDALSSQEDIPLAQLSLAPNPVDDLLKLSWVNSLSSQLQISITNFLGREIYFTQLNATERHFNLPVADYPKGIYFVRIQSGNYKATRKWIKN